MSLHDLRPYPEECQRVRELLGAREDGPLAPGEEVMLRDHLDECEGCRSVASWMSSVDTLASGVRGTQPPDAAYFTSLRTSVLAKVLEASQEPKERVSRPWWRRWPVIAPAAVAVALVGLFTLRQSEHTPVLDQAGSMETKVSRSESDVTAAVEKDRADANEAVAPADGAVAPAPEATPSSHLQEEAPAAEAPAAEEVAIPDPATLVEGRALQPPQKLAKAEPTTPLIVQRAGEPAALGAQASLADADEVELTLEQMYQRAVAVEGTEQEPVAIAQLLDVLATDAGRQASRQPHVLSPLTNGERQRMVERAAREDSTRTLADAIAEHLAQRSKELDDGELRARIEAWLDSR